MFGKIFLQKSGFIPRDNASGIFYKNYPTVGNYRIEVDLEAGRFNFGDKIKPESGTTQNFSQEENWVVFDCVNRLLEKGYKPEDIILEKTWQVGHGGGGRLDILVKKNNQAYLMIECKTWGPEFDKEFKKLQKDGGQLFTYFQQDKKAEYLMLYASQFDGKEINFKNEIVKIEEHYRDAGNVKDLYDRWNNLTKQSGIFDDWVKAYYFQSKALTRKDLKPLEQEDSISLFNKFEAILRKHTVSDGPNAFNKIFNLFLAKIFDEKKRETDELDFQWKEGLDNHVDFQIRLINLHKEGMWEFLKKEIEGIKDSDFNCKTSAELFAQKKKMLKFNKIFDIKEVFDDESFEDNARVLKEVVELLSKYQVRYPRKQQHLSDFFERLLTTGLKQKAGQFFTPPPIARFIIKSLPLKEIVAKMLSGETPQLPAIIDYAAGSGHFLTESMEEIQKIIDKIDTKGFYPDVISQVDVWTKRKFDWASKYIYGIEKDHRLVKVAKVGCYFYGDGLAQVIYGDGLDNFSHSKSYRGLLVNQKDGMDNSKFDLVISNPPYSVQRFRTDIKNQAPEESFELYESFTDNSGEIECLFIERTKQLLKDGGLAGIILPFSILSNSGIYTKAREILLKYFEIIAIIELGSGTFMATGTNTVVLFLRRRANGEWEKAKNSADAFFRNFQDHTANGVENIFSKYAKQIWGDIGFEDYASLCQNRPNEKIKNHDIYREYEKKTKAKNGKNKQEMILAAEKEKLLYFILAYPQKVAVVKSGKKKEERAFLGYDFSNRRGYEGVHAIQRGKPIDECTKMYDSENQENPDKANYYIYKAFKGERDLAIAEPMKEYVFYMNLAEMMTFDRVDFEKTISLSLKKTSKIESKWNLVRLEEIQKEIINGSTPSKQNYIYWDKNDISWLTIPDFSDNSIYLKEVFSFASKKALDDKLLKMVPINSVLISCTATIGKVNINKYELATNQQINAIICNEKIIPEYLAIYLKSQKEYLENLTSNLGVKHINLTMLRDIKIPLPPKEIQEKIVSEIEKLEEEEEKIYFQIQDAENKIKINLKSSSNSDKIRIGDILILEYGSALTEIDRMNGEYPVMGSNGVIGYHNDFIVKGPTIIIGRKGSAGKIIWIDKNNYPIDTAFYVKKTSEKVDYKFLFYALRDINLEKLALGAGVPGLNRNDVYNQNYDLPILSEQQKIVAEIEKNEDQIFKLNQESQEIKNQKAEVLKKYL